jgi:cytochrome c5
MKKLIVIAMIAATAVSCGEANTKSGTPVPGVDSKSAAGGNPSYDPKRGEGKFTKVDVSPTLNAAMAESGNKTFGVKCGSCHKLTEEKLVGPGWKGVTARNTAEWIMNFITNPDVMLDKDPKAQAQLELCLVRMPNQNLADEEARSLYEFMRKNDGVK